MSQSRSGVVGSLVRWDDERGFGFIRPNEGGRQVFVHISAFSGMDGRPAVGDLLVFDVVAGEGGRGRAEHVQSVDRGATRRGQLSSRLGRVQPLALLPVALLAGYLWFAVAVMLAPLWVPAAYVGMSVVSYALYAADKQRARAGQWRITEATLQVAGLACGWPGAVLAQQLLRHKNRKLSFQVLFWILAALNGVVLVILVHETRLLR